MTVLHFLAVADMVAGSRPNFRTVLWLLLWAGMEVGRSRSWSQRRKTPPQPVPLPAGKDLEPEADALHAKLVQSLLALGALLAAALLLDRDVLVRWGNGASP